MVTAAAFHALLPLQLAAAVSDLLIPGDWIVQGGAVALLGLVPATPGEGGHMLTSPLHCHGWPR